MDARRAVSPFSSKFWEEKILLAIDHHLVQYASVQLDQYILIRAFVFCSKTSSLLNVSDKVALAGDPIL
jgi:hypothetical protein